ncbi:MAG: hypothetical protein KAJ19_03880 [Gammaproteobacteria bacterium]|nr:hypothetical protein [Gammaproteobacteria bacterium]
MAEQKIEYDCECDVCQGTGLYVGMGERAGAAVVCSSCKGTGHRHIVIKYCDFEGRQPREDVRRVYATNPGIAIGEGNGHKLEDFGGMPLADWENGEPFPNKSENRAFTCPAWWYQSADYSKKPDWRDGDIQCAGLGSFSRCPHFHEKTKCWAKWDAEQSSNKGTK